MRQVVSRLRSYSYGVAIADVAPSGITGAGVYFKVGYAADAAVVGQRLGFQPSAVRALATGASMPATAQPDVIVVVPTPAGAAANT